jgi:hypothetical protein
VRSKKSALGTRPRLIHTLNLTSDDVSRGWTLNQEAWAGTGSAGLAAVREFHGQHHQGGGRDDPGRDRPPLKITSVQAEPGGDVCQRDQRSGVLP